MLTKRYLFLAVIVVSTTGCFTYKISQGITTKNLEANPSYLTGTYSNTNGIDSISLWQVLTKKAKPFFKADAKQNQKVKVEVLNKKSLKIILEENSQMLDSKIIKGHFKDSAFYMNKKRKFVGFPFVYLMSQGYKVMLGIGKNDSLVVDTQQHRFGWIFIIAAGYTQPQDFKYAKVG